MIFKINKYSRQEISEIISNMCGKKPTFFDRLRKKNFGTTRYLLTDVRTTSKLDFEFDNMNSTYLNFDLWNKGIVFYFQLVQTTVTTTQMAANNFTPGRV